MLSQVPVPGVLFHAMDAERWFFLAVMTARPHLHCSHRGLSSREPQPPYHLAGGATTIQNSQCPRRSQAVPSLQIWAKPAGACTIPSALLASVSLLCELDHPTNSSVLCLRVQGRRVGCWEETGGEGSCGRGIWWWMQSIRLSLWPTCSWVKGIRPWWSTDNLSNPGRRWGRIPEAPSPSLQQNRVPFSRPCALQQDKSSEVSQLLP